MFNVALLVEYAQKYIALLGATPETNEVIKFTHNNTARPGKGTVLYPGYNIMVNGYNIRVNGYNV